MNGIIHVLDSATIDKIAAGEVVEKPASVVKELVENAIDAKSTKITVEIKEGGISLIRVTDNGCGIDQADLHNAFMRHATSKIETSNDLASVLTLGFRGEALSSISAVAQVEMVTKKPDNLMGSRICCNGGTLEQPEEIGAPDGTTIIVRNLFYNTPVRKKFLHTSMTEGSYISELMQHIALSHPEVAFSFIQNGQTKFFTSGNGDLKEVIYRIFGKEASEQVIPIDETFLGIHLTGYIGRPELGRANRNYETFFINGRYIKSKEISSAVEEGYKTFLMMHKYPFVVLHFDIPTENIDINVHPTKMEIRILDPLPFTNGIKDAVKKVLSNTILLPSYDAIDELCKDRDEHKHASKELPPEPFEKQRANHFVQDNSLLSKAKFKHVDTKDLVAEPGNYKIIGNPLPRREYQRYVENVIKQNDQPIETKAAQMELFSEELGNANEPKEKSMQIIGQVFKTYWIIEYDGQIYFIDQHAAHEKVNFENWMEKIQTKTNDSQMLMPPVVVSMSPSEKETLHRFMDYFHSLGFEIEDFGGDEVALRGVPQDLYGQNEKDLFLTVLDELHESPVKGTPDAILYKIASMSCKAAVKGNQQLSLEEAKALFQRLFSLENPYHCPHGRPTMFSMSKYEMEKKFKRIV